MPPVQRIVTPAAGTFGTHPFETGLTTRQSPALLGRLGHFVAPDAPGGTFEAVARPLGSRSFAPPPGAAIAPLWEGPPPELPSMAEPVSSASGRSLVTAPPPAPPFVQRTAGPVSAPRPPPALWTRRRRSRRPSPRRTRPGPPGRRCCRWRPPSPVRSCRRRARLPRRHASLTVLPSIPKPPASTAGVTTQPPASTAGVATAPRHAAVAGAACGAPRRRSSSGRRRRSDHRRAGPDWVPRCRLAPAGCPAVQRESATGPGALTPVTGVGAVAVAPYDVIRDGHGAAPVR